MHESAALQWPAGVLWPLFNCANECLVCMLLRNFSSCGQDGWIGGTLVLFASHNILVLHLCVSMCGCFRLCTSRTWGISIISYFTGVSKNNKLAVDVRGAFNFLRKYRYTAYRQMTQWWWGWLGREVRVELPACAVTKIRLEEHFHLTHTLDLITFLYTIKLSLWKSTLMFSNSFLFISHCRVGVEIWLDLLSRFFHNFPKLSKKLFHIACG